MNTISLAIMSFLGLAAACAPAGSPPEPLEIETYTSSTDGYGVGVSSHLVLGPTEALLVDGQLYRADAEALVQQVRSTGRTLATVVLTHAHPDHFMGLEVIRAAFPEADFVATAAVRADYDANAPATLAVLRDQIGDLVADRLVALRTLEHMTLEVDGQAVDVVNLDASESAHGTALVVPSAAAVITGDLVSNDVHLYLGECTTGPWKAALETLAAREFANVYPGHGPASDASSIGRTLQYLENVVPMLEGTPAGAIEERVTAATSAIATAYPAWKSSYLLTASTTHYFTTCAR